LIDFGIHKISFWTGDGSSACAYEINNKLRILKYLDNNINQRKGRAVAQRLDAGFPPRRPGFAYWQHVGFVVDKAALE
jgi:hypothetical protein